MNFLSPAFLIALPLVAIPVIIHLLSRRQQKPIAWGAMRFLMEAATRRRRMWRLTDLLLLLLRTAAFLFFIFALARPLLPAAWLGGAVPREVILVLDPSLSMNRRSGGASLFELQLQRAYALLGELKRADSLRVLIAGESPEWLTDEPVTPTAASLRQLRARLEQLRPSLAKADLAACIREAVDLEPAKDKVQRVVILLSDGQRFGWRLDEPPLWTALQARLEQAGIPTTLSLQWVESQASHQNLSLNRMDTARPHGSVGHVFTFTATVQNHGDNPSQPALLSWEVEGQPAGIATVPELAPGASIPLSITHSFSSAGKFAIRCHLDVSDAIAADNEAALLVDVYDRLPILLVEESTSPDPLENDAPFVLAALGRGGNERDGWRSVFEPTVLRSEALTSTNLRAFRCVVVVNPGVLSRDAVDRLEEYARNGGGIWFVLGDRTSADDFNNALHRGDAGLVPWKIKPAVGDPNDRTNFYTLRAASDSHPATRLLADLQRLDLDRARIYRRFPYDILTGKDVSVLLQFQDGDPAVVEKRFGTGRVIVQAYPLGVNGSTLPLCQVYVAMLHEWFWYLSEPTLPKRNLAVGDALVHLAPDPQTAAELELPDGRKVSVPAFNAPSGPRYRYLATRWPGNYALRIPATAPGGEAQTVRFQVQRDPRESDLADLTGEQHQQLASLKGYQEGGELNNLATTGQEAIPRRPLDGWLLGALPFLLLGEMALAGWTTHRRNSRGQPATMQP